MEKSEYNELITELSILYEIASISSQETEEELAREVMERAIRLFGVHYFSLTSGEKVVISYGFRNPEEISGRIKQNKPNQIHFVFKDYGERTVLFMEQSLPIQDRQRRLYNIFAHRIEKALLATKNQNKLIEAEKLAIVAQIASEAAHEVKNPLAVIKAGLYYLKQILPKEQEKAQESLFKMDKATDRATFYINDLLDLSRPLVLKLMPVEVNKVLEESLQELPTEILTGIKINKDLEDGMPQIKADPERLKQVFANLIRNASESMEKVESRELRVESRGEEGFVRISISDAGKGIPEEEIKHIFDPFFTTKAKGIGLGLAICNRIIDSHKGEIKVKSKVGEGTTFIIRLKLK